jgi:hypothetical protein
MIQVGPESAVQSLGYDLTIANSDDVGSGILFYETDASIPFLLDQANCGRI